MNPRCELTDCDDLLDVGVARNDVADLEDQPSIGQECLKDLATCVENSLVIHLLAEECRRDAAPAGEIGGLGHGGQLGGRPVGHGERGASVEDVKAGLMEVGHVALEVAVEMGGNKLASGMQGFGDLFIIRNAVFAVVLRGDQVLVTVVAEDDHPRLRGGGRQSDEPPCRGAPGTPSTPARTLVHHGARR